MAEKEGTSPHGAPAGPSKLPLILALVNIVAVLGAAGMLFYVKMVYKRPAITEEGERDRLAALHASPVAPPMPGLVNFEPTTVNIQASPDQPKPADGTAQQIQGKLHYVTVGFSLELRDANKKDLIEELRPVIMDKLLSMLGHKAFHELTTVQGRYMLRTQILDMVNKLAAKQQQAAEGEAPASAETAVGRDSIVTNVFFTQFVVQ